MRTGIKSIGRIEEQLLGLFSLFALPLLGLLGLLDRLGLFDRLGLRGPMPRHREAADPRANPSLRTTYVTNQPKNGSLSHHALHAVTKLGDQPS